MFKFKLCYFIKAKCVMTYMFVCASFNSIYLNKQQTMQIIQRYGFRNSIEQTVSPCIAHVQGSCFT